VVEAVPAKKHPFKEEKDPFEDLFEGPFEGEEADQPNNLAEGHPPL
jgi:hypothetical protein